MIVVADVFTRAFFPPSTKMMFPGMSPEGLWSFPLESGASRSGVCTDAPRCSSPGGQEV